MKVLTFDYPHLFEYPILEIRQLLRAAAGHSWRVGLVTATLGIQVDEASKLMETLLEEGFVALDAPGDDSCYELTIKGRALAMPTDTPWFSRSDYSISEITSKL